MEVPANVPVGVWANVPVWSRLTYPYRVPVSGRAMIFERRVNTVGSHLENIPRRLCTKVGQVTDSYGTYVGLAVDKWVFFLCRSPKRPR
jgi:hypothetical protein